jgi:hypothetical protein
MYKRPYIFKILIKGAAILAIPPITLLAVVGYFFPPKDFWSCFFWILGTFGAWILFVAGVAELLGSSLPEWIGWDVLRILNAFDKITRRTLHSIRDRLPVLDRRLERSEIQEVWKHLERGRSVLIKGESGSGKSGIAADIVRKANERGIPTLFLDTRNYSSAVSAFGDLEQYVGVRLPLRDCLERLAKHMGDCLLVIDQLDSVVGTPAYQVSTELLATAATLKQVKVVTASCILEAVEYKAIRDLEFDVVKSNLLDGQKVAALLQEMGVGTPSEAVLTLSENLFYLSLVAELATEVDVSQVEGEVALLEKYQTTLEENEGPEVIQAAIDLAYEKLQASRMDFTLPRIQDKALQRLQSLGIVIPTGHGLYRFRHEQLLYYFYAQGAIERNIPPVNILNRIAGRRAEGVLVWVLRLYYYHRRSSELTDYLQEALAESGGLDFYEKAALLDEIQTWPDIASYPLALDAILRVLSVDTNLERYFFRHLAASENLGWFEPLRQRGFFDTPPEPIERDGTISYPAWPTLWYLFAVAPKLPEGVIEVAEKIHTQDSFLMLELVRVARSMPPAYAARMAPLVILWADEGMKVEENVIYLATYLAQEDQWEAALTLVELILSPQEQQVPQKANSKAERYLLQAFVERGLAFFLEHRPLETLHIVQRNLEQAIEIEEPDDHDGSWIWRPAIEPHEQNMGLGEIKDLLVDAAVQALSAVVESTPDQGRTVLEAHLEHHYSIFRRLAIHTIRLNADLWPDLVEHLFTERQHLEDTEIYHEYWMLMHDAYDSLPASVQDGFVERLLNRLPQERIEDEKQYHRQRYWVFRRLWALKDSLSSDEHRRVLAELVNEYGEPDYPSLLSYTRAVWGSISSKTSEELSKLSPEEILAELKKKLPFDFVDEPTQEGLADALKAAVASTPQHFASIAPKLFGSDIPPIYTYHALWGFREAWKEGKPFDWEFVLDLCDKVCRTSEEVTENGEPPDMQPGYWIMTHASARSAVADLLEVGVVRDDNAIPSRFLERVRNILLVLADDPNPSPEYEHKWGTERPFGMLDLALNVTRGKAVEALLQYALHVVRISAQEQELGERPLPPESRMEEAVRDKLTEKLDKQADSSLAVHSLFGKYFPNLYYLDKEWVVNHLEDIFPRQPEMSDYWEAAWDGYLFRSDIRGYLHAILQPYYRYAIEQIALGTKGKAGSELSRGRLSRHLAAFYWHGVETLEDDDSLIALFFDSAPDEIRAGFVAGLGAALREIQLSPDSEEWRRVKTLWEARDRTIREIAEREGHLTGFVRELSAYTGWVPFIPPEELENFYPMIERSGLISENWDAIRLLEFFASVAGDHAPFVISFLERLVQQDRGPLFLATKYDIIRTILEAAMNSGDEQARSCAVRVINLFGERGDERYRDLLRR